MPNFDTNTCQFLLFPCLQFVFLQLISPPPMKHSEKSGINMKQQRSPRKHTWMLSEILECARGVSSTSVVKNTIPWMMEVILVHLRYTNWLRVGSTSPLTLLIQPLLLAVFNSMWFWGMQNWKWELQMHNETFPKRDFWLVPHLPDLPCPVSTMVQTDSSQRILQLNCEQTKYCKKCSHLFRSTEIW